MAYRTPVSKFRPVLKERQQESLFRVFSSADASLRPGLLFERQRTFSQAEVRQFLDLTGDPNAFHCNSDAAREQGFAGAILPGLLCASLFPAIVASQFPGALYASQDLRFVRPLLVGRPLLARVQVCSVARLKVTFATTCLDSEDAEAIVGQAVALLPRR